MNNGGLLQTLLFPVLFAVVVVTAAGFFLWLVSTYLKVQRTNAKEKLSSKIWYCKTCWHYEYAEHSQPCPLCSQRKQPGDEWRPVPELTRGQPDHESSYRAKQRILDTEDD